MDTRFFFRLIQCLRGKCSGWPAGSSLLWAIGALVVMGVVGAGLALMTPATMQSKLQQEAGMKAYYNANAGLNFIMSMNEVAESNGMNFSSFLNTMGGTGVISYNVGADGYFTYALGSTNPNGVNGTYQIVDLNGTVTNSSGGAAYKYAIYGGGKGGSRVISYTKPSSENAAGGKKLMVASSINVAGYTKGDILAISLAVADGVTVIGSITTTSASSALTIKGGTSVTGDLCSNNALAVIGGSTVTGTVRAQGDVTITSSTINGDIYAGGDVTISGGSTINGNIYSQGDIIVNYATIGTASNKKVISGKTSVTIDAWETLYVDLNSPGNVYIYNATITGDVYYGSSFVNTGTLKGTSSKAYSNPPAPSGCDAYITMELPPYSASLAFDIPSSNSSMNTIKSGTYNYTTFTTGGGTKLCLDVSGGDIVILTTGNVSLNGNLYIKTASVDNCASSTPFNSITASYYADAAKVFLGTKGTFTLNGGSDWFGAVLANGNVQPGGGSVIVGSLYSISGTINPSNSWYSIRYVQSNYLSK